MLPLPSGVGPVQERLAAQSNLTGAIDVPAEGSVLPDTYDIEKGESRQAVLLRMQAAMQRTLAELDRTRSWMLLLGRKTAEEKVAAFLINLQARYARIGAMSVTVPDGATT